MFTFKISCYRVHTPSFQTTHVTQNNDIISSFNSHCIFIPPHKYQPYHLSNYPKYPKLTFTFTYATSYDTKVFYLLSVTLCWFYSLVINFRAKKLLFRGETNISCSLSPFTKPILTVFPSQWPTTTIINFIFYHQ